MVYKKEEQNQGEDLVDPDFHPIFLYEIDDNSELFESDNFSECSSSTDSEKEVGKNLQDIIEDDEEMQSSSDNESENDKITEKDDGMLHVSRKSSEKRKRHSIFHMKDEIKAKSKR